MKKRILAGIYLPGGMPFGSTPPAAVAAAAQAGPAALAQEQEYIPRIVELWEIPWVIRVALSWTWAWGEEEENQFRRGKCPMIFDGFPPVVER